MPHPLAGSVPLVTNPIRMSASSLACRRVQSLLGQHTDEVLEELGYSSQQIQAMHEAKAV